MQKNYNSLKSKMSDFFFLQIVMYLLHYDITFSALLFSDVEMLKQMYFLKIFPELTGFHFSNTTICALALYECLFCT